MLVGNLSHVEAIDDSAVCAPSLLHNWHYEEYQLRRTHLGIANSAVLFVYTFSDLHPFQSIDPVWSLQFGLNGASRHLSSHHDVAWDS